MAKPATRVKLAIVASGLTTVEIGAHLGCHPTKVSRWASGARQPKLDDAISLAGLLGTTVEDLWPNTNTQAAA